MAYEILESTSGFEPLSETAAPRYLKLIAVYGFCILTLIYLSLDAVRVFVINMVFAIPISIIHRVQGLSRLSDRASSYCCFSARASMTSANHIFEVFLLD